VAGRLDGKVAIVTGGANGIGRACCLRFADEGADVVVADVLEAPARAVAREVVERGRRATTVACDAADPNSGDALVAEAVASFGGLDILVTAAGVLHGDYRSGDMDRDRAAFDRIAAGILDPALRILDVSIEEWRRVLEVNLTGTFLAVQAVAAHLVKAGRSGSIITIASIAAKHPEAGPAPYAVSKAGVWMLTKAASRALGPRGIRVNAIGPGFIRTNMTRVVTEDEAAVGMLAAQVPMGRIGEPDEVAACAAFLASDDASYVSGEILHPDGGFYTD